MGSTEQRNLQSILQAIIDQGNLTVTEVNASVGSGTDSLEVFKNIKLQELSGAAANHTITLNAQAQELVKYISEQGFRIRINQANHGFTFNPIQFDVGANKYVKATINNPADAMAIRVNDDNFDLVTSGSYPIGDTIKDVFGDNLVVDEYYFLDENVAGGFTPIKPTTIYQPLFLVAEDKGKRRALIEVETPVDLEPRILNDIFDEQVERVVIAGDAKIEEIKTTQGMKGDKGDKGERGIQGVQGIQGIQGLKGEKGDKGDAGSLVNIANNEEISLWLGTTADYEAIVEKSRGVLYQHFDADGNFAGGYFKELLQPVKRGLVEWFDFADGKGTETTLKSRVSDNVLTLTNFNFDANSGWTGKGLRFDGVDDYANIDNNTLAKTLTDNIITIEYDLNLNNIVSTRVTNQHNWTSRNLAYIDVESIVFVNIDGGVIKKAHGMSLGRNHVVFTQNDSIYKAFINGNFLTEETNMRCLVQSVFVIFGKQGWKSIYSDVEYNSIKIYNVALTPEEIAQNYKYEQSIDRTTASTYPMLQKEKSYGIGLSNQLSEEQKATFRLSVDKTKFVAGLRYCEGLEVVQYTYANIQKEMEKEEWTVKEEEVL